MSGRTISVTAEWARRGKTPDDSGYRLLGCSDGTLSRQNFEDAISRYLPGTLDTLPQVSVAYLARADRPGGSYLSLAIHEFAEGGQFDAAGREIAFTRYFCVPYEQVAHDAISYRAMYEAVRQIQLPDDGGPPQRVTLTAVPPRVPADDYQMLQVASLLLDGPVCVLGADATTVDDRLRFIDTVMSLLPYGMRSRMSASTWTSSTYQTHRFRLFFSSAPRANDGKDHAVVWGQPERTEISPGPGYAYGYLAWLEDKVHQPVLRLSELTGEFGFGAKQVLQMLEFIGITGYPADQQDLLHPTHTPPQGSKSYAETLLRGCVQQISDGNQRGLKSNIAALRNCASSITRQDERRRYQDIIFQHQLLRPGLPISKGVAGSFYDALLRLAFGMPLSYEGYCQVEDCLGLGHAPDQAPHHTLLKAIDHGGMADTRVTAIVRRYLGADQLDHWFHSGEVDIGQLIAWLAEEWDRPRHAQILCDTTVRYLVHMRRRYDPRTVLAALRQHGYLAQALHLRYPHLPQYQVEVLANLLLATTGGTELDRQAVAGVMLGTGMPPTPELLAAVLILLADPADEALAREYYVTGQLRYMTLDPGTRARLNRVTPDGAMTPGQLAIAGAPALAAAHHEEAPRQDGPPWPPTPPQGPHAGQLRDLNEVPEPKKHRRGLPALVQRHDRQVPGHEQ